MKFPCTVLSCLSLPLLAQGPTDPTSCAVNDIGLTSVNVCVAGAACDHASVLANVNGASLGALPPFSLVSGFTMPVTGREFAMIGASNGVLIVDTHDLASTLPGQSPPLPWMDFEAEDLGLSACAQRTDHRGVVAYPTATGALVIESNLWRPYLRTYEITPSGTSFSVTRLADIVFTVPPSGPQVAPRMTVDAEEGVLFVAGVGVYEMHAYDLESLLATGVAPAPLWVWTGGGASGPVVTSPSFDVHLFRSGGAKRIAVSTYAPGYQHVTMLDISNLVRSGGSLPVSYQPLSWAMFATLPGTHSTWVDAFGSRLYNSWGDAYVDVYELAGFPYGANNNVATPPSTLQPYHVAQPELFDFGSLSTWGCHTLEGLGLTGYASGWTDGLRLVDLRRDCLNPDVALAFLETCNTSNCSGPSPCLGSQHFGAWSVFFRQDSGVIYVSDQNNGLFLARAEAAHLHRFGKGATSAAHPQIPQLTLDFGPPRVTRPMSNPTAILTQVPELDTTVAVTVSNIVPAPANLQIGVIDVAVTGDINTPLAFDPAGLFPRFGQVNLAQIPFDTTQSSVYVKIPLAGAYEGLPVFLQAAIFQAVPGGGTQVVATSRGSFVGIAAQRNP